MNDLVQRMDIERASLTKFANILRRANPANEAVALHLELRSMTIGYWQSEVMHLVRENEALKTRIIEIDALEGGDKIMPLWDLAQDLKAQRRMEQGSK